MSVRIGIVAGEASGDMLGAHLIRALKQQCPHLQFIGVAGPLMQAEGAQTLFPLERLSLRGFLEVFPKLLGLLKLRYSLYRYFVRNPPSLFIGIDAPDFNFWLERKLKQRGVTVIHYVSPSIWAWRSGRIHAIKSAVSHVLALFPFEVPLYEKAGVSVSYVGHPLADSIAIEPEPHKQANDTPLIALLPGSRQGEVRQHARLLLETAKIIQQTLPEARFIVPLATSQTHALFMRYLTRYADSAPAQISVTCGQTQAAIRQADVVLVASGTATLEVALHKKPMVIFYRMSAMSGWLLRHLFSLDKLAYVGLPNILLGRKIVPEFLQDQATPEHLAQACLTWLSDASRRQALLADYTALHDSLRQDTAFKASQVVLAYLQPMTR